MNINKWNFVSGLPIFSFSKCKKPQVLHNMSHPILGVGFMLFRKIGIIFIMNYFNELINIV
jgi:hypothetical protein